MFQTPTKWNMKTLISPRSSKNSSGEEGNILNSARSKIMNEKTSNFLKSKLIDVKSNQESKMKEKVNSFLKVLGCNRV